MLLRTFLVLSASIYLSRCQRVSQGCDLIDVGLLIDRSFAIGEEQVQLAQQFVFHLLSSLELGLNNTRVTAIQVDRRIYPLWFFADSGNFSYILQKIPDIQWLGWRKQRLSKAILYLSNDMFTQHGDRADVPDVAIIFTNGRSTDIPDYRSRRLKKKNIRVLVVPIGDVVNMTQLNGIASHPSSQNIFNISDVDSVVSVIKQASLNPCADDEPKCPGNQVFSMCAGCVVKCSERNETVECPAICRSECTCPPNTFLLGENCVEEEICPHECPGNQVYSTCAGCSVQCSERSRDLECPSVCRSECTCPPSTFLLGEDCVEEEKCPPECPFEGMKFNSCATSVRHCFQAVAPIPPSTFSACSPGCACLKGSYLHEEKCIPTDECPAAQCGFIANATVTPQPLNFYGNPSFFNQLFCEWRLTASNGHHILINITHFSGGFLDELLVIDGDDEVEPIQGILTVPFVSFSNRVTLRLRQNLITSDLIDILPPFDVRALFQEIEEIPEEFLPASLPPSVGSEFSPCGFTKNATAEIQALHSPGYPEMYRNNLDCEWTITARTGYRVQFQFSVFKTEECCDHLTFFENGEEVRRLEGDYKGSFDFGILVSAGEQVVLKFRSDGSRRDSGFMALFKETNQTTESTPLKCGFEVNATHLLQVLTLPRRPGFYNNKEMCFWTIRAPPESTVVLFFDRFETEHCCDFLQISDGGNITRLSGSLDQLGLPQNFFSSSGNTLELTFTSDNFRVDTGFRILYFVPFAPAIIDGNEALQP